MDSYSNLKLAVVSIMLFAATACSQDEEVCSDAEVSAPQIILVVGQSNTHAGLGLDPNIDIPEDGIYQLGRFENNNCIIQAAEPLDHHTKSEGRIGFALTFAKLLKQQNQHDILIVPCGFGGTGFADNRWNKGNDLYEDAVDRINTVKEKYPDGEMTAILWHQGETDVFLGNQNYQNDMDTFISNLRNDLGDDSIPFILGGMVPYWVEQAADRQQQQQLIKETTDRLGAIGYADPTVPTVIEKTDNTFDEIHFDAAGQRELGQRYFQQFLLLTE